jgi:diaminopimelate epimerase
MNAGHSRHPAGSQQAVLRSNENSGAEHREASHLGPRLRGTDGLRFSKMHGAGNDFVILDRRGAREPLSRELAARLAHRHLGVGCDQVITIETPRDAGAVARYGIWNTDGSPARQCGNGARCVAAWLRRDGVREARFRLESPSGTVEAQIQGERIAIGMGVPDFMPDAIGLRPGTPAADPYMLDFAGGERLYFGAVSMGNPHAVLEVNDVTAADVARVGPRLQQHPLFGDSCNVGFAQVLAPDRIKLRVYERGVGETLACGSGACAAVAVLARRGRVGAEVDVELPGGTLRIDWAGPGRPLWMAGPAEFVFEGEFIA